MGQKSTVSTQEPKQPGSEISHLRDVLFGQQFREFEVRAEKFETRLNKDLEFVKRDFSRRLDALESVLRDLGSELKQIKQDSASRWDSLENSILKSSAESAQELKMLRDELKGLFMGEANFLESSKVDRMALASMLSEVVARLNEGPVPGERAQ